MSSLIPHNPSKNMHAAVRALVPSPADLADVTIIEVPGDPVMDEGGKQTAAHGILSGRTARINGTAAL